MNTTIEDESSMDNVIEDKTKAEPYHNKCSINAGMHHKSPLIIDMEYWVYERDNSTFQVPKKLLHDPSLKNKNGMTCAMYWKNILHTEPQKELL